MNIGIVSRVKEAFGAPPAPKDATAAVAQKPAPSITSQAMKGMSHTSSSATTSPTPNPAARNEIIAEQHADARARHADFTAYIQAQAGARLGFNKPPAPNAQFDQTINAFRRMRRV